MTFRKRHKNIGAFVLSILVLFGLAACSTDEKDTKEVFNPKQEKKITEKEEAWNYDNQDEWAFEAGDNQSPIDVKTSKAVQMQDAGKLDFNYAPEVSYIEDNGHSIEVGGTGTAILNGRAFDFKQVHFHAESEHTVNGKHYPIEAHFVNASKSGRLAVVGVFFKEGEANAAFDNILKHIKKGEKVESTIAVDLEQMLPKNQLNYYHYLGSLTTPPLTENVEWYVLSNPIEVSAEQIKQFQSYYNANNRNIQELDDRTILEHIGE